MPDIIITPSTGKLEFIDNSAQVTRRHSFTLDHSDGLVLDAPLSAAAISAPLNVINVTVNNSNANYPFVLAQSGETGAKNLLMDGAGGTYNPFTNTATIDISGNSATTTLASDSTNLGGVVAASYVTLTGTQTLTNKTITGTFTGNLTGTGSWATNAVSAVSATTATNSTQLNGQAASYYTNIPARLGYTPVNQAGDTIAGNLTVNGNFTVNGSVTAFSASNIYLSSSVITVEDNILTLNAFSPYLRYAGIEMYDSGSGTLSQLLWDGDGDYFFLTGSSVNGKIITGPDGQTNLTSGYIPKATAGYKLGNSLIYDNGTNVAIGTTSPAAKLDVVSSPTAIGTIIRVRDTVTIGTGSFAGIHFTSSPGTDYTIGKLTTAAGAGLLQIRDQSGNQFVTVDSGGNVGIGISNPSTKLDVVGAVKMPVIRQSTTLYDGTDITDDDSTRTVYFNIPPGGYSPAKYFKVARIKITGNYQNVSLNGYFTAVSSGVHVGYERKVEFDFIAYAATNAGDPTVTYLKRGPDTTNVLVYAVANGGGAGTTYYDIYIKNTWYNDTNGELAIRVGYGSAVTIWQAGLDSGTSAPVDTLVNPNSNYAFDTSGNVGIGTTNPSRKLHIYSATSVDTLLESGTSGTSGKLIFKTSDNADLNKYIMQDSYYMLFNGHGNEGFKFRDNSNTVLMTIYGTTNSSYANRVGIGTTAPATTLHVVGVISGSSFSGAGTGLTGTAANLTAGTVTTNANLTGDVTSTGNATTIATNAVTTTKINSNSVTFAKFQQVAALSVVGVSGNSTANVAAIAGSANQVLRVSNDGTALAFGQVNLAQSQAVTGTLAINNGGTGAATAQLAINALAGAVTNGQYLRGNGTNVVMSAIQAADVPTLNQNTTGNAATATTVNGTNGQLLFKDIRAIAPNNIAAGYLQFGFTTWTNTLSTTPYADYLHLRSYTDSSGGNDNLVMFRKDVIGMRIWQQTFGSASNYSTYKDVAFTDSIGNGTITIAAGTGVGVGASNTFTTNQSGATTVTITNTGVTAITTNTGLSTNASATGAVTITNTGVTSITTNTGLSTNASATGAVTITNTGVTSNVAGTGISVSGATGAVTITNSGVTSAVAGTGVGVSAATGAVTFSIGQAVGTGNSPTFTALTTTVDGANHIMAGSTNAEGIRMTPASSTTYPVFLRSINPGAGEASPWIYKEQATDWGIWHNNPVNSIDFTKQGSGGIANNVGGSSSNTVTVRVEMATGFVQTIAGYRNSAGTTILSDAGNITGNAATVTTNANLTGDVTSTGNATTIASNAVTSVKIADSNVTLAKIVNISTGTILGNNGAGAAAPLALTSAQVASMLSGQTMNIGGNAATATILQTARNIGGVSFNGSADINLPGVNTAGNQNTSGNAATATTATNANAISFTEVELNAPATTSGTWTTGNGSEWGEPKFGSTFNQFRYTDGDGPYVEYNVPANHHACFISQLQWDTGGYADCHGVQSDGDLVFLRRINTRQLVENSNHGNTIQHDGSTVTFVGSGLGSFTKIRITNRSGRIHMTGIAFTRQSRDGYEGTGMVHPAQISHQGAGSGLNADLLDGYSSATANTANTIVLRDASGNFSAGTITATLSGNASTVTNGFYTTGGQTIAGITYFSNGESMNVYGIRGRFTNEYLHLYNKVGVGHPGGWGQGEGSTPNQGLSTYGGITVAYGTNATSIFYGNVGVGTTVTYTKAHVYGTLTVDAAGAAVNSFTEGIRLGAASNGYSIVTFGANATASSGQITNQWWIGKHGGDNSFNFNSQGGGDVFRILQGGNVGIGSNNPQYKLDVNGGANVNGVLTFGGVAVLNTVNNVNDIYANIRVIRNTSSTSADGMYINYDSLGTTSAHLRFYANAGNERMRIQANDGHVGIGTSSAGRRLDVEGIVRTRGASGTGGFEIGAATTGAAKWRIEWDSASDSLDFNWVG